MTTVSPPTRPGDRVLLERKQPDGTIIERLYLSCSEIAACSRVARDHLLPLIPVEVPDVALRADNATFRESMLKLIDEEDEGQSAADICAKVHLEVTCEFEHRVEKEQGLARAAGSVPDDLRELGWHVAVHNDYSQRGTQHTFWLMTKDGRALKGEGASDREALNKIRAQLDLPERAPQTAAAADTATARSLAKRFPVCATPGYPKILNDIQSAIGLLDKYPTKSIALDSPLDQATMALVACKRMFSRVKEIVDVLDRRIGPNDNGGPFSQAALASDVAKQLLAAMEIPVPSAEPRTDWFT